MPHPIDEPTARAIARRHVPHAGAWLMAYASTGRIDHADPLRPGPLQDAFRALAHHRHHHPADADGWRELVELAHHIRRRAPQPCAPALDRRLDRRYAPHVRISDDRVQREAHVDTTAQDTRPALLRELDAQIGDHESHEDFFRTFGEIEEAAGAALHWSWRGHTYDDEPDFWEATEYGIDGVVRDAQTRMDQLGYSRDESREALAEALDAKFRDLLSYALRQIGTGRK